MRRVAAPVLFLLLAAASVWILLSPGIFLAAPVNRLPLDFYVGMGFLFFGTIVIVVGLTRRSRRVVN